MFIHLNRILIDNTAVSVAIDGKGNIHVLDLDEKDRRTLTNAIDAGFQFEILKEVKRTNAVLDEPKEWILYHTDGYITKWDGSFLHVEPDSPDLYKSFLLVSKERRESYNEGDRHVSQSRFRD